MRVQYKMEHVLFLLIAICIAVVAGWIIFSFFGLPFLVSSALTVLVSIIGALAIVKN